VVGTGGTDVAHTGAGLRDIILAPSTDGSMSRSAWIFGDDQR